MNLSDIASSIYLGVLLVLRTAK